MASVAKNSLDLLRLVAATLVLYSHQHALTGQAEPSFFGWNTFGGAGVTIFFFLIGLLVWSSWERDPDLKRFFLRRSLRIFPALWVVVIASVFLLGPVVSNLSAMDYFASSQTWRYLSTALLVVRNVLPGVFADNPYPLAVNGSLWTLPVEFLCYVSVALLGSNKLVSKGLVIGIGLLLVVLLASIAPMLIGDRFSPHFEMVAVFWWGVFYQYCSANPLSEKPHWRQTMVWGFIAMVIYISVGPRGVDRSAMLVVAAALVIVALKIPSGARVTDRLGDLSYGLYIFAFPIQQLLAQWSHDRGWSFGFLLCLALALTSAFAYASWHLVEKQAFRLKPSTCIAT
ncbi:acyltransferase [Rhodoferax sp. BLA1]|uniref:acyltransferase family protein n=1 Tax=Rhodoferax sp. BLA1 TaxID=2576062 RepID=UPI0015D33D48|nr:acyltransferase [Rhodoferax sp. BLA1]